MKTFKQLRENFIDGYLRIGHGTDYIVDLWVFVGNRFKFERLHSPDMQTHYKVFGSNIMDRAVMFGRVDHTNEKISVFLNNAPEYEQFSIMYDLKKRFPKYEIMKFSYNNRYMGTFKG